MHLGLVLFEQSFLQLNSENRINLLCAVESCENTPEVLLNIFTEAAIAGLDKINEQVLYILNHYVKGESMGDRKLHAYFDR